MRPISDTISRLAARRAAPSGNAGSGGLMALGDFGSNPGQLKGWYHAPDALPPGAPLVVVLHGCTQNAQGYDAGSGWSALADRHDFAVLYPEQQRTNNANLCFNWFAPEDIARGGGEALSIRQMVARMTADLAIDPARVFVTGLSAGGAMTAVLLATYPDVFAGGAVIAGLPFGCATTMPEAFDRMRGHRLPSDAALAARVRDASPHTGPWPTLSVWQGTADTTVVAANMEALIRQWRALQDLPDAPSLSDRIDGQQRRVWHDAGGAPRIEAVTIAGMGHGTPIDPRGPDGLGTALPYMLDVGISSTRHIADFWSIAGTPAERTSEASPRVAPAHAADVVPNFPHMPPPALSGGIAKTIDDALRAAGLLR